MAGTQTLSPSQVSAANMAARQTILHNADMQTIVSNTGSFVIAAGDYTQPTLQLQPACVGLELGFVLRLQMTITNNSGATITLTPWGVSNMLRNINYSDPQSVARTNVDGKFLHFLMSQKQGSPMSATTSPDATFGAGWGTWASATSINGASYAPTTIASGGTATIWHTFYLPLAKSHADLTGAVWGQLQNAFQTLNITMSKAAQICTATGVNPTDAIYQGGTGSVAITAASYRLQLVSYTLNLPMRNGQYIVPLQDIGTVYAASQTTATGLAANQDFLVNYPASWSYESVTLIYDNAGLNPGTDVNNMTIATAAGTEFGRFTPSDMCWMAGNRMGTTPPYGTYYFSHHQKPISTALYGSIGVKFNPLTVNAGANLRLMYEYTAPLQLFSAVGLTM